MRDGMKRLHDGIDFGLNKAGGGQERAVADGTARVSKVERIMQMPRKRTRQIRHLDGLAEMRSVVGPLSSPISVAPSARALFRFKLFVVGMRLVEDHERWEETSGHFLSGGFPCRANQRGAPSLFSDGAFLCLCCFTTTLVQLREHQFVFDGSQSQHLPCNPQPNS